VTEKIIFTEKEFHPIKLAEFNFQNNCLTLTDENSLSIKISVVTDYIFRVRYGIEGIFERDFSYALDPKFEFDSVKCQLEEEDAYLILSTAQVKCKIAKANLAISFLDEKDTIINEDEKGFHWEKNEKYGGNIVQLSKKLQAKEAFYGLGDKPSELNLRGKRFQNWGTDNYGYSKNSDPLYKNIPFFYGLHNGIGYGIFFDNTFKSFFDFGSERNNASSFWAQGGEMNYYFIAGPKLIDVCKRYTLLTGTPEMPPLWSLGFQQCKWSYQPEEEVRGICSKLRELKIPCDAIYLDIDYMDGFRCFTWDKEKFPNPKKMVEELKEDGFKTMVIIDPGIKKDKDYEVYKQGLANDYFCKHLNGAYVEGKVWPGDCYFPDFTHAEVREWWAGLYKELIEEIGVAGVWNDMNEPALFEVESKTFPHNVLFNYEGEVTGHRKAHNIYGMQMARATANGVKKFSNGKRSLIITRSGYSGLQRYSSVWTGDNIATWEHLWIADAQCQRLSISGISFAGSDIGGFIQQPSPELFVRWIQLGIFHPFCRVHSSGDHGDQEPWSFGEEATLLFKEAVELRYELLPYIYTTFYQYHKFGNPMLIPLVFYDQLDQTNINHDKEFLLGDSVLVSPVLVEESTKKRVQLPRGKWYNYRTDAMYEGAQEHAIDAPLDAFPFFIKAGAVIPIYPVQQYVGEKEIKEITLKVYFASDKVLSYLYDDDKDTYAYEGGAYKYSTFEVNGAEDKLTIKQSIEGTYNSEIKTYKLSLIGLPFEVSKISVDGVLIEDNNKGIIVSSGFNEIVLE